MARGWESKAVETQIETTERESGERIGRFSRAQVEILQKRDGLLLSRARVLQDLETARNPRYRKLLEDMLAHIEQELNGLGDPGQ